MLIRDDVLKLTMPIVAEQFFVMSLGVVNTIMASRIGKEAVSAIGMVDSLSNILIAFFSALAIGGTVVVAHYTGQNNVKEANETARQALFSGLLFSLIITIFTWTFQKPIIALLYGSADAVVIQNALIYLNITLLTYPLISITSIASGVLRGAGDSKTPMTITMGMNLINIIFSYILIYGIHIQTLYFQLMIPGFAVKGAAIGISIARAFGALLSLFVLFHGSRITKISIKGFKVNMKRQEAIFGIGIPASIESLLFNGGKLITQVFIVGMGTVSIASNYIAGSIVGLVNIPGSALGIAATTLVGQSMGRGDSHEAGSVMLYLTKLASACMLMLCIVSFPFARQLASIYTQDEKIILLTTQLLQFSFISTPLLWPISFVLPAGLKGAGDAKYTMVTSILGMWAFRITLGYILGIPLRLGVPGIWMGMYADWLVRGVLYLIRLRKGKWKQNVVIK